MGYIDPPHIAKRSQPSYAETYQAVLTKYRTSPHSSASSVVLLVATPDVDALCAARMLSNLLHHDDIIHRTIPVAGFEEFQIVKANLFKNDELHTLFMLNLGALLDLGAEWLGADDRLKIHVIDSSRPINLGNYFLADQVTVWDDGKADTFEELRKSLETVVYAPNYDSSPDDDTDLSDDEHELEHSESDEDEYGERDSDTGKRRSLGDGETKRPKRRRTSGNGPKRLSRAEYADHQTRLKRYYKAGSFHGQSASGTIYILATVLERVDNDFLWLAIIGLTYQYTTSRIPREGYDDIYSIYHDEVSRLNPPPPNGTTTSINPDDASVRTSDELRFTLFRHWTLYDAMYHSSYVASKLGIWKERGRKRLTGLLAKMGFSIPQTQQPYPHMDMDLKKDLVQKLNDVAPEYGLVELSYPSFIRCYGYRSQPLSASDAVEGISALMDVANGVRIEVEIEGARNGGEWFGGGKTWEANVGRDLTKKSANHQPAATVDRETKPTTPVERHAATTTTDKGGDWWVKNFWAAYDALNDIASLHKALSLSMALHRAIIRQGTSIIDKQDIKTMRTYRVVILSQGPDLSLFTHPGVLSRLALWLVDALRDRVPSNHVSSRAKRKSLPFIVACLKETAETYVLVGIMAALDFGEVERNDFGNAFLAAKKRCNTQTLHTSFDAAILEIPQKDLKIFLDALCEGPEDT